MERTNVHLSVPLKTALKKLAAKRDTTVAELIRRAIEEFLKVNK